MIVLHKINGDEFILNINFRPPVNPPKGDNSIYIKYGEILCVAWRILSESWQIGKITYRERE